MCKYFYLESTYTSSRPIATHETIYILNLLVKATELYPVNKTESSNEKECFKTLGAKRGLSRSSVWELCVLSIQVVVSIIYAGT